MGAVNAQGKHHHAKSTPYDRLEEARPVWEEDICVGDHTIQAAELQAVMAKNEYINYEKLIAFIDCLPEVQKEQYQTIVKVGQLVYRITLQKALDAADMAACSVLMAVVMTGILATSLQVAEGSAGDGQEPPA